MESVNKSEVQKGTERLASINEDSVLKIEELRAVNAMKIEGMKEFVKNNRKEPPKAPDAGASHEAMTQYQVDVGSYNEMKGVLDRFDAQISALKTNYEKSKGNLKEATQDELAKLEAAVGIAKPEAAKTETVVAPAATEKKDAPKAETPAAKPEAAKETKAEAVAPAPEKKEDPKTAEYVIKKGDNLTKIAKEHGTTVSALAKENGIKNVNVIHVGQKLKVPAKAETKPATAPEAAKAAKPEAKAEAGKDGKPADAPKAEAKTEKKADAPASKGETEVKAAAKADVPPPATATVADKAKIEATAKPEPTKVAYADTQTPISGAGTSAAGGSKK